MNSNLKVISGYTRNGVSLKPQNIRPSLEISEFFKEHFENRQRGVYIESSKVKTLFTNQLLKSLSDADFERILPHLELVSFSAGTTVYQPEDEVKFIYFPENAVFSQFHILKDGRTVETAMIGKEGITGFSSISGSNLMSHFLQVSIGGNAFRLNIDVIKDEIGYSNAFRDLLFEYANIHISHLSQRVLCNNHHLLDERFCTWLLMLLDRCQKDRLELTHDQISGYLGVHRPSVTHIAQTLREKNIIKYSRGHITVINRQKLENLACECYRRENLVH